MNVNLFLKEVFITTLREVYFQSKIENYPFFFEKKNITVEQSKVEMIRGTKYIIEEKVIYDSLGILEIYAGASEGFVVYSRDNDFGKSVIKEEGYSNKVLIDKKQDCLIDGKDTIRNFEVFLKDRLIMVYPKEGDRIYVYKFK